MSRVSGCIHGNSECKRQAAAVGGILQAIMFPVNLGRFGNSIAIWLGIEPYELFFYIFLPPLLFDAAVRIDFFMFKKVVSCKPAFGLAQRLLLSQKASTTMQLSPCLLLLLHCSHAAPDREPNVHLQRNGMQSAALP